MEYQGEIMNQNKSNIHLNIEEEKEILAAAIDQSSVGILMTDIKGNIIYVNNAIENMSGYKTSELIGNNPSILKSGLTKRETYKKMWETISSGGIWNGEQINKRKDGTLYYEDSRITPIYNKNNELKYYLAVKHDITERKVLESRLQEIAIRDGLTNAYNRRYLMDRLYRIADNYKRVRKEFSIAILDIDHFKSVNDKYGHLAGDVVLVELVRIINKTIRSYDILGRYGGEEFILVLPDTDKNEAYVIINRILNKIRNHTIIYDNNNINITFSAGIAGSSEIDIKSFNAEALINLADNRLYNAKDFGRDEVII